jgi:pimeloyl-ACP methyl ester carboxylesterase
VPVRMVSGGSPGGRPVATRQRSRTLRTVTTGTGRTLCVAEWGNPEGAPVFSMHGTPGCRLLWRAAVEYRLEDVLDSLGVRLIRYDRPGYGCSGRQQGRSIADTAVDVGAIADAFGIERFSVQGGSFGTAHALAVGAILGSRVRRVACVAPMAPYDQLGSDAWSRGQSDGVRNYVASILEGEHRLAETVAAEDAVLRARASRDDPRDAAIFEQARNGLGGWIDDELAILRPWGFELAAITAPTRIWYDPNDVVLPRQHAEWLAEAIPGARLTQTSSLGHGSKDDPRDDWRELFGWLLGLRLKRRGAATLAAGP